LGYKHAELFPKGGGVKESTFEIVAFQFERAAIDGHEDKMMTATDIILKGWSNGACLFESSPTAASDHINGPLLCYLSVDDRPRSFVGMNVAVPHNVHVISIE
jgi:hypothetical protein